MPRRRAADLVDVAGAVDVAEVHERELRQVAGCSLDPGAERVHRERVGDVVAGRDVERRLPVEVGLPLRVGVAGPRRLSAEDAVEVVLRLHRCRRDRGATRVLEARRSGCPPRAARAPPCSRLDGWHSFGCQYWLPMMPLRAGQHAGHHRGVVGEGLGREDGACLLVPGAAVPEGAEGRHQGRRPRPASARRARPRRRAAGRAAPARRPGRAAQRREGSRQHTRAGKHPTLHDLQAEHFPLPGSPNRY